MRKIGNYETADFFGEIGDTSKALRLYKTMRIQCIPREDPKTQTIQQSIWGLLLPIIESEKLRCRFLEDFGG